MTATMLQEAERVQGDIGAYIDVVCQRNDPTDPTGRRVIPLDLTNVSSVVGYVWRRTEHVTLSAAVNDPPGGVVRIQLGATAGQPWLPTVTVDGRDDVWMLEAETTWGDGSKLTHPSGRPLRIRVRAQGDPTP